MKQSYKVRLGMFDTSIGVLFCTIKLSQACVYSFGNSRSSFLVLYGERYNDLEKHICSIKHNDIYFDHFHPCAALTAEHVSNTPAIFVPSNIKYISQLKRCLVET